MTRLSKYEKMDEQQLLEQQKILRENIREGKTSFGNKAMTVLKSVLFGALSTVVVLAGAAAVKGYRKGAEDIDDVLEVTNKMAIGSAVAGLGALIPYAILDRRHQVDKVGRRTSEELTHVERLLREKAAAAKQVAQMPLG